MSTKHFSPYLKRVWIWAAILTLLLCVWPVEYRLTRLAIVVGVGLLWIGAFGLWWKRGPVRFALLIAALIPVFVVFVPGRTADPNRLAAEYAKALRAFKGVRYVWGGEGFLGIDCSGLARKGLVWAQLAHGIRTLNGKPIRDGIALWWNDCSAEAMRDGYRGWTSELCRQENIVGANHTKLRPGDLAVTADGVHVIAFLGDRTWIEADPDAHEVIQVSVPTTNQWFQVPVVCVRWRWLLEQAPAR